MAVNLLLSYAFHADTDLRRVRTSLVCGRLLIDSGAFTAHTKGRRIELADYAAFLERWRGCWDHAITLDVIGDPAGTRRNTRALHARGLPVMPVFTPGDTVAEFEAMVRDSSYVAAGGLVGMARALQVRRVRALQRRAADLGGGVHALGVGSMTSLRAALPYSADASTVSGAFKFGKIVYFDGRTVQNTGVSDVARLRRDHRIIRDHGIDLAQIATDNRMPKLRGRQALMQAMSLAYATADEHLRRTRPVTEPGSGPDGLPGTHLYSSLGAGEPDAYAIADLDRILHSPGGPVPPIWRRYRGAHTCYPRKAQPHAS